MTLIATPALGRRRFIFGAIAAAGAASAGAIVTPTLLRAQDRVATPASTAGPFYPVKMPPDVDNDLVVLRGSQARAEGVVTHITGRVLGTLLALSRPTRGEGRKKPQFLIRYPVLKIHHTMTRHANVKSPVIATLMPMPTSEIS